MTPRLPLLAAQYYEAFVVSAVVTFTPFKAAAYVLPAGVTLWLALHGGTIVRNRLALILATVAILGVAYELVAPEFLVQNYVLALLTYSALIPVLIVPSKALAVPGLVDRMIVASICVASFEGTVGVFQAVYGAIETGNLAGSNGDYVTGTLSPFAPQHSLDNPTFVMSMILLLLACLARPRVVEKRRWLLWPAALAIVLASVVHALVYLVAAVVIAILWLRPARQHRQRRGSWLKGGGMLLVGMSIAGYLVMHRSASLVSSYVSTATDFEALSVPRAVLLYRIATELPEDAPLQPFVGLGPGQFSSRASLIASGRFLGGPDTPKPVPFVTPESTVLATEYCIRLLISYGSIDDGSIGSSQQPFFSWLAIYTELGLAGLIAVGWFISRTLRRIRRHMLGRAESRSPALAATIGIIFIATMGLQETYWEVPQAMLVGLLLLKVLYAEVVHGEPSDYRMPGMAAR